MKRKEEEGRGRKRKGEDKDEVLSVVSLQDVPFIRLVNFTILTLLCLSAYLHTEP